VARVSPFIKLLEKRGMVTNLLLPITENKNIKLERGTRNPRV